MTDFGASDSESHVANWATDSRVLAFELVPLKLRGGLIESSDGQMINMLAMNKLKK